MRWQCSSISGFWNCTYRKNAWIAANRTFLVEALFPRFTSSQSKKRITKSASISAKQILSIFLFISFMRLTPEELEDFLAGKPPQDKEEEQEEQQDDESFEE